MNLRLARQENRTLKSINAFLGFDFKVCKESALDADAERAWKSETLGYEITRVSDTEKTIGGERPCQCYELGFWMVSGGSYWQPPDSDYVVLRRDKNFDAILFLALAESKRLEWINQMEYEAEKELDSAELEW